MKKTDRRVKRTKKLLKDALARLLLENDLHKISVSRLTEVADVSRGAFYTHYQDIFDLYEQMENDLMSDLDKIIITDPSDRYDMIYERIVDYVYENADVCRIFMGSGRYREKLSKVIESHYSEIVKYEMKSDELKEEWKYLIHYQNEGFIAALHMWLDNDFSYPKEKLLKLYLDIDRVTDSLYA